jgi:hypothetical protein
MDVILCFAEKISSQIDLFRASALTA